MSVASVKGRRIGLFRASVAVIGLAVMFSPFAALFWLVYEVTK